MHVVPSPDPATDYITTPDEGGDRVTAHSSTPHPEHLLVDVGSKYGGASTLVAPVDRLPLAARIAHDQGLVLALPGGTGALPELKRDEVLSGWAVAGDGRYDHVPDDTPTEVLLAVVLARLAAETETETETATAALTTADLDALPTNAAVYDNDGDEWIRREDGRWGFLGTNGLVYRSESLAAGSFAPITATRVEPTADPS